MQYKTKNNMIAKLNNSNGSIALQIFTIFQNSYKIEAQLIGAIDFPPLFRSADDIKKSKTQFYGFSENGCLAAIIEITNDNKLLDIHSLTVDPNFFRKGIANNLISYVLETIDFTQAIVETAEVNVPAINLYKKHGFVEFKKWTPSHGIEKVAMSVKKIT